MLEFRRAEVTDDDPLEITLGGSQETPALAPRGVRVEIGDFVTVLTGGERPVVLGNMHAAPSIAYGTSTATFSTSADSAEKTVAHGLDGTPSFVSVQYNGATTGSSVIASRVITIDGTNFTFQMNAEGSLNTTIDVLWFAAL